MAESVAAELYRRLMTASRDAFAAGYYEAAYHALVAAMHAAEVTGDALRFAEVEGTAREQIGRMDVQAPAHRLGTAAAGRRNHPGVCAMLVRECEAKRVMAERRGREPIP